MKSSEATDQLAYELANAQSEFPVVPKLHTATIPTKTGGGYSYRYADLADCVAAATPILTKCGLAVTQHPDWDGMSDLLTTRLMHKSGQWVESSVRLFLAQESPQSHGSAITYARRYALCSIIGLVADVDDDGAAATHGQVHDPETGEIKEPQRGTAPSSAPSEAQMKALEKIHATRKTDLQAASIARWGKSPDKLIKQEVSRWLDELNGKVKPPEPDAEGRPF